MPCGACGRGRLYSTSYKLTKFQLLPGSGQQVLTTRKLRSNRPKYRFVTTRHTLSSWICSCGTCNFVTKITQSIWFEKNCPRDWFVGSLMILPVFMSPSLGLVHSGKLMTIPCSRSLFSPNSPQLRPNPMNSGHHSSSSSAKPTWQKSLCNDVSPDLNCANVPHVSG